MSETILPGMRQQNSTCARGQAAELRAAAWLETEGYVAVEKNFRWRGGEVDLVVRAPVGRTLVFVEVRSSTKSAASMLRWSLRGAKRERLRNTVAMYRLKRRWARGYGVRFDVIWVEGSRIEHWKNVEI